MWKNIFGIVYLTVCLLLAGLCAHRGYLWVAIISSGATFLSAALYPWDRDA